MLSDSFSAVRPPSSTVRYEHYWDIQFFCQRRRTPDAQKKAYADLRIRPIPSRLTVASCTASQVYRHRPIVWWPTSVDNYLITKCGLDFADAYCGCRPCGYLCLLCLRLRLHTVAASGCAVCAVSSMSPHPFRPIRTSADWRSRRTFPLSAASDHFGQRPTTLPPGVIALATSMGLSPKARTDTTCRDFFGRAASLARYFKELDKKKTALGNYPGGRGLTILVTRLSFLSSRKPHGFS